MQWYTLVADLSHCNRYSILQPLLEISWFATPTTNSTSKTSKHSQRCEILGCSMTKYSYKQCITGIVLIIQCYLGHMDVSIIFVIAVYVTQIKICAEYRDMLPRPRLVCQEPGPRAHRPKPRRTWQFSWGLGSMSRYSAQILICFIAYILHFLFLCGFGWELCRTAIMPSALCHCLL